MKKLDEVMARTDELLFQMIPKAVAERIRKGESYMDTCEVFPSVTMLFSGKNCMHSFYFRVLCKKK